MVKDFKKEVTLAHPAPPVKIIERSPSNTPEAAEVAYQAGGEVPVSDAVDQVPTAAIPLELPNTSPST